jgi:energy-coupling factor transport system ATP-binding protein
MIIFDNVSFEYKNRGKVLDQLKFKISPGEIVALIGRNGAGKTTILKHMNGLFKPTQGRVLVAGMNTAQVTVSQLAKKISFLFQNPDHQIFLKTVAQEIAFGPQNIDFTSEMLESTVREAAQRTGLIELMDRDPSTLGKGIRQRVALASILAMKPEVLVLDEPTTGQDEAESCEIMEVIREVNKAGTTVILVTHDMELAREYAERILVLSQGRLVLEGEPDSVFSETEFLAEAGITPPLTFELRRLQYLIDGTESDSLKEEAV